MDDTATITNSMGVAAYLIPIAVFFTLVALLLWRRKARRAASSPSPLPVASTEALRAVQQPLAEEPGDAPGDVAMTVAEIPQTASAVSSADVMDEIEMAQAGRNKTSLAGLYLKLATAYELDGDHEASMSALRSAAGNGALHGPPAAHGAARLALGEAAHRAGDLTSACEQWQIARTAFLEGGDAEQHARVEKRMRDNGCPTDWVLTDF